MYIGFKHLHSYLAYAFLLVFFIALFVIIVDYTGKKPFSNKIRKLALVGLISAHLQLVIGLIMYLFLSPLGLGSLNGAAMKDSTMRLYALEHPLMMLLGIIIITIGYSKSKRATQDNKKYKILIAYFSLGLILILSRIPWQVWP
jgi:hypothetical protein